MTDVARLRLRDVVELTKAAEWIMRHVEKSEELRFLALVGTLTRAEREVLAMMASGLRNKEIARRRRTSLRTTETQIFNITAKMEPAKEYNPRVWIARMWWQWEALNYTKSA